jgi:hypothetical protein
LAELLEAKAKGMNGFAREPTPHTHFAPQWSEPRNHCWTFFFFEHQVDTVLHGTLLHSCCSFLQSWLMGKPFSFLQYLLMLLSTAFSDFADGEMYSWPVGSVAAGASYFGFLALCAADSFQFT